MRMRFGLSVKNSEVRLTPKEFELLLYLARHAGRVVTHRTLLLAIWGPNSVEQPEHLRVLVAQLRKKIDTEGHAALHRHRALGRIPFRTCRRKVSSSAQELQPAFRVEGLSRTASS